jgi:DNA-binding IclR family transcriptional regulator
MEVVPTTAGDELQRLRAMFAEVPGTHVTASQAARLCGVDQDRCAALLAALVDVGFLRQSLDGRYRRAE